VADAATTQWLLRTDTDGTPRLVTRNSGSRRVQIADLRVLDAGGRTLLARNGLLGYVLAGAVRRWSLDLPAFAHTDATAIEARIDGETRRQTLSALPSGTAAR